MNFETKCLHEGYTPKNGEPDCLPIYQSTAYKYDSTEDVAKLFDLTSDGYMYSRISNPTCDAVEKKIASLEGGVGALCTTSGQSASLLTILNLASTGDHVISTSTIYGGTVNLFSVTLKRFGIEVSFVNPEASEEEINATFRDNTRLVFGETLANPALNILDIEKFAKIAHSHNVPLCLDNTFPTPYLCRPIEFGADIIIHSTTKYLNGHALNIGGVIVDSGNFPWDNGKFPEFTEPDASYHGICYTKQFGKAAFIVKARVQLMRDIGCYPSAMDAFILNIGIETLAIRMERHCENALAVAKFLQTNSNIESLTYPGLEGQQDELREKYLPKGCSGVISVVLKGGRKNAIKFMDKLKLTSLLVHVADIRSCALHPASSTHRQLTDEQLVACGIEPGMVRLSIGLENIDDIIEDLKQALDF